jgi:arsenite methyltransferase
MQTTEHGSRGLDRQMSHHLGLAGLLPGEHVLELGCGSGADVSAAAEQVGPGGSVTGIDITLEELAEAERLCPDENVSFRWGSPHELPFEDGSFDAVISKGVVHLWNDKPRVFAEVARVLRPGGRLALTDTIAERRVAARSASEAYLWAASIADVSETGLYLDQITAAGLELQLVRDTPITASRATGRGAEAKGTAPTASRWSP